VLTLTLPSQIPVGANAVALNLGGTQATGSTYLTVFPGPNPVPPSTSNLNLDLTDSTAAVYVVVPIGSDGKIRLFNYSSPTHAFATALGYYRPGAGIGYTPLTPPQRILDTRAQSSTPTRVPAYSNQVMTAPASVPADTRALVVNVTVTNETGSGYVTVAPGNPTASSTVNYASYTRANMTVVTLDANRHYNVYNNGPPTDIVIDLVGYFADGSSSRYVPLTPVRVVDTRIGNGGRHVPLGTGGTMTVTGSGIFDVPYSATALMTGVVPVPGATSRASYLTVWPSGARPVGSSINFTAGRIVPNAVVMNLAPPSDSTTLVRTSQIGNYVDTTDIVVDVFGYFTS
jgi:hypothetical protein